MDWKRRSCCAPPGGPAAALIVGGRDRMTVPKQATGIAQTLGATVHTLPTAGHALMQEDPDGLLAALRLSLR